MGAHAAVDCDACHKEAASGQFVGLSTECASCHLGNYLNTRVPDHQAAKLPIRCDECHNFDSWQGAAFDHARFTGFELAGAHARLECVNCHTAGFTGTPANCFSCHARDFEGTTNPNHVKAGFPHDCSPCHNSLSWVGASFDHGARTKFTLTGAHSQARCDQCHIAGRYEGTPQDCASCHIKTYEATKNPDHKKAEFPAACANCHSTERWQGAQFDHSLVRFPLTGTHATLACMACHGGGAFADASSACASCHLAAFTNARNPNHATAGFPQDCALCHNTTQWKGAKFDHSTATKFELTGSHVSVSCTECHKNNLFQGTSSTCVSCHLTGFNNASNPKHAAAGFPQDCTVCHTTTQWKGAKFDHSTATKFLLTGAHPTAACTDCHKNNVFRGLPSSCVSCHLKDFNNTANPNHAAAGFPQDCTLCHTTTQWKGTKFDHNTATKFPLTGAHPTAACTDCHKNHVFAGTVDQLRLLPSDELQQHHQSEPCRGRLPAGLHALPHDHPVEGRKVRPQPHEVSSYRRAHCSRLPALPRSRPVRRPECGVCILPPDGFQQHRESEPCHGRLPAGLLGLSHDYPMEGRKVRPQHGDEVPADRRTPDGRPARQLSREQCVPGALPPVRLLPSDELQQHHQSEPRRGRLPAGLLGLPHDYAVEGRKVRPQHSHEVPADRRTPDGGLHGLSQEQRIRRPVDQLRLLPSDELQQHHQSEPRRGRLPAGLLGLPHDYPVEGRKVRSQHGDEVPADRCTPDGGLHGLP